MIQKQIEKIRAGHASKTLAAEYIKRHLYQGYRPCKEAVTREHVADSDCYVCTFEDGSMLIDDEPFLILILIENQATE